MKWKSFTKSRFLSVGHAAQGVLGSLAIGLSSIISNAKQTPSTSDRLQSKQKQLLVIIIVVSNLLSELQALILADDRLSQQYDEIQQFTRDEIQLAH